MQEDFVDGETQVRVFAATHVDANSLVRSLSSLDAPEILEGAPETQIANVAQILELQSDDDVGWVEVGADFGVFFEEVFEVGVVHLERLVFGKRLRKWGVLFEVSETQDDDSDVVERLPDHGFGDDAVHYESANLVGVSHFQSRYYVSGF